MLLTALATLALGGCDDFPNDIAATMDEIRETGVLHAGIVTDGRSEVTNGLWPKRSRTPLAPRPRWRWAALKSFCTSWRKASSTSSWEVREGQPVERSRCADEGTQSGMGAGQARAGPARRRAKR